MSGYLSAVPVGRHTRLSAEEVHELRYMSETQSHNASESSSLLESSWGGSGLKDKESMSPHWRKAVLISAAVIAIVVAGTFVLVSILACDGADNRLDGRKESRPLNETFNEDNA
ncbi:hypothetical protein GQ53DRAFT_831138 [Thozetella sp. PMI_491]|nr:hypothetical protein GQ53DRAFT_831138 [Thozetella sp. PMI_491]